MARYGTTSKIVTAAHPRSETAAPVRVKVAMDIGGQVTLYTSSRKDGKERWLKTAWFLRLDHARSFVTDLYPALAQAVDDALTDLEEKRRERINAWRSKSERAA